MHINLPVCKCVFFGVCLSHSFFVSALPISDVGICIASCQCVCGGGVCGWVCVCVCVCVCVPAV